MTETNYMQSPHFPQLDMSSCFLPSCVMLGRLSEFEGEDRLEKPTTTLTSYTGDYLQVFGQCNLKCNDITLKVFVVKTGQVPIIGLKASQDLNLIKIVMNVNNAKKDGYLSENVSDQFPKVFEGLGCLKKPYHIKVNPEIVPVVSLLRRQPV